MESICTELPLYSSKNECVRTDTVFLPLSEVCNGNGNGNGALDIIGCKTASLMCRFIDICSKSE